MFAPRFRLGPPHDASLDGHRVDALFGLTAELVGGCFVIIIVVLAYLLVRYRARPGVRAKYLDGASRWHLYGVLAVAAFVFVGIDFNLIRIAHADLTQHLWHFPRGHDALRIEVMSQRWLWNMRYAGADGQFATADDVTTVNDLRVPVNTPVVLQLAARDVIHSLFLPNFRIKQDAIPGRITRMWFQATETGTFDIACAQLCGFAHYQMRGTLTVMPRAPYERWLSRTAADSRRTYDPANAAAHWGWAWPE